MVRLKFVILGEPISRQAPMVLRSGIAIHKKKEVIKKQEIKLIIKNQLPKGFKLISAPVLIRSVKFVFKPLKSLTKNEKQIIENGGEIIKTTKPDIDNLEKLLYDSLEGIIYDNDSKIYAKTNIYKCYGLKPRIEIELESRQ